MKITFISDTHGLHRFIDVPEDTELLIHAGDISNVGRLAGVRHFLEWYNQQPGQYKVFIGGNHDFLLEQSPSVFKSMLLDYPDLIYLENEETDIEGIKIWGSPISPFFHNWAFNRFRGEKIRKYWEMIPQDIDILITHGPPYGIGDRVYRGEKVGCQDLLDIVQKIQPRYHVFGHIHEDYGVFEEENTTFINASCLNLDYKPLNAPITIEW